MRKISNADLPPSFTASLAGDVLTGAFDLGRYATDASIYQMVPRGVIVPKTIDDVHSTISFARKNGLTVLPRGGGTSQCGQTVNHSLVIDTSKYFNRLLELDVEKRTCVVEPGIVLDDLNRQLKPHGLWFPVDVSTASRATIGGMAANNSCGGRSLRYGTMRDNVRAIEAVLSNGDTARFSGASGDELSGKAGEIQSAMLALGRREADEIATRFPKVQRRVGGYNIDALVPGEAPNNLAHLLVGSEGTLSFFTQIELKLSPLPGQTVLGVCHFPTFTAAMEAAQHLVTLKPQSVELVDQTMMSLARDIAMFRPTLDAAVEGDPAALLLVEFAADAAGDLDAKLDELNGLMGDLGFSFTGENLRWGGVRPVKDAGLQADIAALRASGLNIMMSMKDAGKPVSFVEDCAVPLADLAAYTTGLTEIFEKHGTTGTWYAHASVGCLHVRPVLNMKLDKDVAAMRSIAEQCFELVRAYKGSHSGEHGDGILRSEFHESMFGPQIVQAFEDVKNSFDPEGLFNPGKIVDAPKMDDRRLFRYGPDYAAKPLETELDWSDWPGAGKGFLGAVEMCNNNGACRKLKGGVMCPSFRVTRNERDVVRGRANSLRLAITGQTGDDAILSDEMAETMSLCVSCKGCKRECPTGVDMARMKIEVLSARQKHHGLTLRDRLIGYLPRYAPYVAKVHWLANARNWVPGLAWLTEPVTGFSRTRQLPVWSKKPFQDDEFSDADPDVLLFADVFNRYFAPENLRAAGRLMKAAGLRVQVAAPHDGGRSLDCGRTFLSVGCVAQARIEAQRLMASLLPYAKKGIPIVGLEPSSLLTLRDEIPAMLPGKDADEVAGAAFLFEEFVVQNGPMQALAFRAIDRPILLHGHCHQKAQGQMSSVEQALGLIPDVKISQIETSCCGMAGAFGYQKETADISKAMGELDLFPAVRADTMDSIIVADGFSCTHQINFGTGQHAQHVVRVLADCAGL